MNTPEKARRRWRGRVYIATSLDGYIARPDGDIGWLTDPPEDPEHLPASSASTAPPDYETFMAGVDHVVMGRGTYEKVLTFEGWPYSAKQVIVLSSRLEPDADDRITVAPDLADVVRLLDERDSRGVYVDGGRVVQTFLQADLIDEITVAQAPVLIGEGLPLFGRLARDIRLTLSGVSSTDNGMTSSTYVVRR